MSSVRKRGEHSYQIIVSKGYDSSGKKLTSTITITLDPNLTEKQAEKEIQRQADDFERLVTTGQYLDGCKISFSDFTEHWLKDYAEKNLAPKTLFRYKELLYSRILPVIGHIKIGKLQPNHLLNFYSNLGEAGIRLDGKYIAKPDLSNILVERNMSIDLFAKASDVNIRTVKSILAGNPTSSNIIRKICEALKIKTEAAFKSSGGPGTLSNSTILYHHRVISSILQTAVYWQVIASNPAERVKPPKVEKNKVTVYDEDQLEKMTSFLDKEPINIRTAINLDLYGGMRLGELAALEWKDIDFSNKTISIIKASQYLPHKGIFTKVPKNESSNRTIAMPPVVMKLLKKYKAWQNEEKLKCGDLWVENDRLFTKWNGEPIYPGTISNWFKKFREKYGLPKLTFHQIRHTNASMLIAKKVDVETVGNRLGHAQKSTTVNLYGHPLHKADREAAMTLQKVVNKKTSSKNTKQA